MYFSSNTYQVTDGLGFPQARQFITAFDPKDQIEFSTARGSLQIVAEMKNTKYMCFYQTKNLNLIKL